MTLLLLGLLLFLGTHSIRIVADSWRADRVAHLGENHWKGLYSLASAAGLALIVWGYGLARAEPVALWAPPGWTRHLAALLTLPAFILIAAAYVPGNRIKAAIGHPMVAGVKIWAIAHLLSNGNLADGRRRRSHATAARAWCSRRRRRSPASSSRSRPTWTRSTATASPSSASVPAATCRA
ncbi:MAG: hypothetical protein C0522_02540 [Rhodocyclaceae bacterium]|jgi:uncharacterized membrane protein|nr:hypothetical protein [Rhodocyclaceae bacterium]